MDRRWSIGEIVWGKINHQKSALINMESTFFLWRFRSKLVAICLDQK